MADILASVSVVLGAEISGFRAAMAQARRELSGLVKFSEGLKDVGTSLTQYVTAPLALFSGAAVAASGKIESLKKGIEAITLQELGKQGVTGLAALRAASEQTTARMAELEQVAKRPGLGFEGAVQGDVRLRAVGISAEQSAKSIAAFANAIATTGGGKSEFDRVTVQLAQLSAKGKVLAQDLRPIIEAAPAVSGALQRLYGTVDSETISASLAKQGKSSTDFIAVLTDELAKLPQVSGGLKNAFENLADTGTLALAKFGDGISQALNLPGVLAGVSSFVERAANAFAGLAPGTQALIVGLAGIAAAVGPVLVAVGTLGAALPAITAGFEVLGVSSLAALGPILPAALAVGAAALVVYQNWDALTAYFSSGPGASLFSDLASAAGSAASAIGEAFGNVRATVGTSMGDLLAAAGPVLGGTFKQIVVSLTGALNVLAGSIAAISGVLTGDFTQAASGASQAFYGLIDPIASLLGFTVRVQEASPILVLSRQATEFNAVFPQLRANLDALNSVQLGALAQQAAAATKQVGLLAALEAQLKEAKDKKTNASTEADIAASNRLIESLEAQIKRLNELGIASKEMQKTYADVQKSLRTVANESLALGDQYDYLKNRQNATESGIKKLIAAGFSPASSAVQRLVADLRNLNSTFLGASETLDLRKLKGADKLFETPEFKLKLPETIKPPEVLPMDLSAFDLSAEGLAAAYQGVGQTLTDAQAASLDATRLFNTQMGELADNLGASIGPLLANFAAQAGDAFGSIVTGAASFGDAMEGLFGGILQALGGFMSQFGQQLIAIGIGKIALDSLFAGPQGGVLAVAAGVGLVALAGVVSAVGKSAQSSLSSIGSGGRAGGVSTSPASRPSTFSPTTAPTASAAPATYTHYIEITASGRDLKGALALETDRFGRVVGVK
jgi:tape measure domain-containing protein